MKTLLLFSECLLEFAAVSQVKGQGVSYYHDCKFDFISDITLSLNITIKSTCATKCQHYSTDYLKSFKLLCPLGKLDRLSLLLLSTILTFLSVEVSERVGNFSALSEGTLSK
jgi:hypothetical protein